MDQGHELLKVTKSTKKALKKCCCPMLVLILMLMLMLMMMLMLMLVIVLLKSFKPNSMK